MDYTAIIWHRPLNAGQTHPPTQLAKIEAAQRTAMKAILGTFRTTATSALEIETSLPPAYLRLREKIHQSFTRVQTAPIKHPINSAIQQAITSKSKTHLTL